MTCEQELRLLRKEARRYRNVLAEARDRYPIRLPQPLAWVPDALAETEGRISELNAALRSAPGSVA